MILPSSWVEVDKKALEDNLMAYSAIIHPAYLAPVIKSNAFGHGIELIAKICDELPYVKYLCVVSAKEALFLRSIGIKKPILILSIIDDDLASIVAQNIDLVAYDINTINALNSVARRHKTQANVHIKIDTGLSRLGMHHNDATAFVKQVHALPGIFIRGIFTHLAESESIDQSFTNHQMSHFFALVQQLEHQGIFIPLKHTACSAAATANKSTHCNFARIGIGSYGLWPSAENKQLTLQQHPNFTLSPVMTWKTRIIQIKDLAAGSFVGYDRTHQVSTDKKVAVLPVGYWDGFDRELSNKGCVVINGQQAPVIGRVAMNLTTVDITGLDVSMAHEVTLLGNKPGITAEDIALLCKSINYEIVTRVNPLLPRYVK